MPEETPETWPTLESVITDFKGDIVRHLDKQDSVLDRIDRKVDTKADKSDLQVLSQKIDGHGTRISKLEEHHIDTEASKRFRRRAWAVAGSVSGVAAIIAGALIGAWVH